MKTKAIFLFIILNITTLGICNAQDSTGLIYKQIGATKLKMLVYKPSNFSKAKNRPAIVFFPGGGWFFSKITQFEIFAQHCASKGMVAVLADYRVKSRHQTTPVESLKDAKSAVRYLRQNAAVLGIDPHKIAVSGGSAGGHLAAACYTNLTINETSDDLTISPEPNALVLFNPVIDNSAEGYGYDRIKEYFPEFSPVHNIRKGFPPTIFFVGTKDNLIPVKTAELFKQKIELVGSRCELFLYKDQAHGFFNQPVFHTDILSKVDAFLQSIGYMD
jgi:acetyl esterase/lipase